jgi:hypothetical protein
MPEDEGLDAGKEVATRRADAMKVMLIGLAIRSGRQEISSALRKFSPPAVPGWPRSSGAAGKPSIIAAPTTRTAGSHRHERAVIDGIDNYADEEGIADNNAR